MVWAYDHVKQTVTWRSTKTTMQERDLYTVDPNGVVDTSLEETELLSIDDDGAKVLDAVISGDRSETSRQALASFLAVGLLRTPAMVGRYNHLTRELVLQLLEAPTASDYASFLESVRTKGHAGINISEPDFQTLRGMPSDKLEKWVEKHLTQLAQPTGDLELPHTDAIRDPSGIQFIVGALLSLEWTIAHAKSGGLVLGDMGPVYEHSNLGSGLRAPLSPHYALIAFPRSSPRQGLQSIEWQPYEVAGLNAESAARASRWLIASDKAILESLTGQLA